MSALADSASLASQDTPEDILPGYSPAQSSSTAKSQLVTHSYSLARKDGRVWLQLIVQSRAASSDQPPVVLGSQTIQGTVEYGPNLKQDAKPKSISILVSYALTYRTTAFLDTNNRVRSLANSFRSRTRTFRSSKSPRIYGRIR